MDTKDNMTDVAEAVEAVANEGALAGSENAQVTSADGDVVTLNN